MDTDRKDEERVTGTAGFLVDMLDALGFNSDEQMRVFVMGGERVARREACEPWASCKTAVYAGLFASLWRRPLDGADGFLTEEAFCAKSGLSSCELAKLRDLNRILCVKRYGGFLYPEFQAHLGGLLRGVVDVNAATSRDGLTGATRVLLMLWPCFDDDSCIIEALRCGRTEEALAAARSFRGFVV